VSRAPAAAIDLICEGVRRRADATQADLAARFTHLLYSKAPAAFFDDRTTEVLVSLALSLFEYMKHARPDPVSVAVVQPAEDSVPWEGPVTVLRALVSERPFVVDSIREYLRGRRTPVQRLLHPVLHVERDEDGEIVALGPARDGVPCEALVHCEIAHVVDPAAHREITERLQSVLRDVVAATDDFDAMVQQVDAAVAALAAARPRNTAHAAEVGEVQDFLRWLRDSFVFLGYRGYDLVDTPAGRAIVLESGSGLGILRNEKRSGFSAPVPLDTLAPELRERVATDQLLIINKTNAESTVHRGVRMDYIGVKKLDENGHTAGEMRFIGLFTSRAYAEDADRIPILRRKLAAILEQGGWVKGSHDYKEAITIFNSMPKEELFLASAEDLGKQVEAVLTRFDTQQVKVALRRDVLDRGVSIMVILPRERYSGRARRSLQAELIRQYEGTLLNFHLVMGGGDQARMHFYIAAPAERLGALTPEQIEHTVTRMIRTWADELEVRLADLYDRGEARRLAERWGSEFSPEYQAATAPHDAVADLAIIMAMEAAGSRIELRLTNENGPSQPDGEASTRLRVYLRGERLILSDFMPILESTGLRVLSMSPFDAGTGTAGAHIYVFAVQDGSGQPLMLDEHAGALTNAILAVHAGDACSDSLNALILTAGLSWREVDILRAYCEYAFQLKIVPSRLALPTALRSRPAVARILVDIFNARFDPARGRNREAASAAAREQFTSAMAQVVSLNEDRTLRRLLALIDASVRTNYFVHGGGQPTGRAGGVPYISFKFLSELLQPLVRTRLRAEVWVQSVRMAGIHMRRGKVSRGGLRHSDRPDDVRTEVLGLVRTQSVKNAVIVPAGSKGGFITRFQHSDLAQQAEEVEAQYRAFIRGLLDITDNLVDGEVVRSPDLVVYDEPDPYLVVAADKGTARFSDVANSVAAEYGFWLDDAFASGGSIGYDHKQVGITARGAWECVRRHFREMGRDTQTEPFTVVGIGDMSGDVFGNGMLLSPMIRLVAAFDHRHIFVDPDPDPATTFAERRRLFELGRSSWDDYDRSLLSSGGFIVPRSVKEIDLTPEAMAALGVDDDGRMDGETLIKAVLRAPVDLLWNGGIGTYVKGSNQSHAAAGDSANDAVRIDASELRCRVLGEGGNLGLTQRARVEFALGGGRCYTDAIDNSGGVELSDREVNLKILFNAAIVEGRIDATRRSDVLLSLTDAVAEKVLEDNRSQSLAVSLDELRAAEGPEDFHGFMVALERAGAMDRSSEDLPLLETLVERRGRGQSLTKPELSVLLAYAKLTLKQALLDSPVPDDPALQRYLVGYFPAEAVEVTGAERLSRHRLSREIIATELGNDMLDLMGAAFLHRMVRDTGHNQPEVARAWFIAARLCGAGEARRRMAEMEGRLPADVIYRWLLGLARVLERTTRWVLLNVAPDEPAEPVIRRYLEGLSHLRGQFARIVAGPEKELYQARVAEMCSLTSDEELAASLITLRFLDQLLEILKAAEESDQSALRVGRAYYLASELLAVPTMREALFVAAGENRWDQRAARVVDEDLGRAHRTMTAQLLAAGEPDEPLEQLLDRVTAARADQLHDFRALLEEIVSEDRPTLSGMLVVIRELNAQLEWPA
jgi:glutamate dehydrogenase